MTSTMRTSFVSFILLFAAGLPAVPPGDALAAERCGDADGSGTITVTDGVQTLRAAAGLGSTCTPARCDLDGSASISVSDGVNVLRAAVGLAVNLACPGGGPPCTAATVTVALSTEDPIGAAAMELAYPPTVSLPGSGDAAAERVTVLTTSDLLNGGQPNDLDDRVGFILVSSQGLTSGNLLRVRFDCAGSAPSAGQFGCMIADVTAPDGITPVAGATCSATVASE